MQCGLLDVTSIPAFETQPLYATLSDYLSIYQKPTNLDLFLDSATGRIAVYVLLWMRYNQHTYTYMLHFTTSIYAVYFICVT